MRGKTFLASLAFGSRRKPKKGTVTNEARKFRPWGEIETYAGSHSILLDFDRCAPVRLPQVWRLLRFLGDQSSVAGYSKSRRGWHVEIKSKLRYSPTEIVVLQLLLGSDPNRELFNFARIAGGGDGWRGLKRWNILYRLKVSK